MANMIRVAMALKPFADVLEKYDKDNIYRPEDPARCVLYAEGGTVITFQHLINAHQALNELMGKE